MSDTLTDRERELVEAARRARLAWYSNDENSELGAINKLEAALRSYDPPKVKRYCMPTWEEVCLMAGGANVFSHPIDGSTATFNGATVARIDYEQLREALATEE